MGFDFTVIAPLLPSHSGFSFVFGCGVSFLVSCSVFLSMIVQRLAVIPGLLQEGVSTHPSTLPSRTNLCHIVLCYIIYLTTSTFWLFPIWSPLWAILQDNNLFSFPCISPSIWFEIILITPNNNHKVISKLFIRFVYFSYFPYTLILMVYHNFQTM